MERNRIANDDSFPRVSLPSHAGGRPVEVLLIAQLDPGAGDALAAQAGERQRRHPAYRDALDEPSALLSAPDFGHGDPASLFSFAVGPQGHPFHRHAGNRMFTAIAGSSGARLRFSTASPAQVEADPQAFVQALHQVEVPADSLFSVRFGGGTWHQFLPLDERHPAFFALSCHPDEAGGPLPAELHRQVLAGEATLADLTELLPEPVQALLRSGTAAGVQVPTTVLSFGPGHWRQRLRARLRRCSGRLRQGCARSSTSAANAASHPRLRPQASRTLPPGSLLHDQLQDRHHYQDTVRLRLDPWQFGHRAPAALLAELLQAFVEQPAATVTGLMRLRNLLVAPLGLRTSRLGCPVSSLLAESPTQRFANRFPVIDQRIEPQRAQVVLGADDRHLRFRSCVEVRQDGEWLEISLSTRVACRNGFGRCYMAVVDPLHHRYIAPAMLATAATQLLERAAATMPAGIGQASR
ncbi:DUF2867 domain-containing protein [Flavobacterium sp. MXW15]|uniref:DUF2867 domain-containing protein n=1 Tax=Xanthomonas chitinilytica TaxID=2989819 RepID=A0ABT3JUY0_9XANT|nr:DUF2867 domain-containing protein [Flavobacterium sp. MXW15]MCW4472307.1 DUF2867 domain-containing protein [Xanthomonas sp. H13-6]